MEARGDTDQCDEPEYIKQVRPQLILDQQAARKEKYGGCQKETHLHRVIAKREQDVHEKHGCRIRGILYDHDRDQDQADCRIQYKECLIAEAKTPKDPEHQQEQRFRNHPRRSFKSRLIIGIIKIKRIKAEQNPGITSSEQVCNPALFFSKRYKACC